jgi:glutathione synthase/RimK-type ligase-like ATP-grasp enzyme
MPDSMRVAFATCSDFPDGWRDDQPAAGLLGAEFRVWEDPSVDWMAFDRVVIRSAWDYTASVDAFLAWCEAVGAQRLRNAPALVAFNADKRYLAELSAATVPTVFVEPGAPPPHLDGEVVVKPNVSAGARDTGRFGPRTHDEARALIARIQAGGRVALVQPYLAAVDEHGETALVFLGGELSHVLRKRAVLAPDEEAPLAEGEHAPAAAMLDDDLVTAGTATPAERELAHAIIAEISARFGTPVYARVDLVTDGRGEPVLLELEVIEPELYLATAPGSSERLAAAVRAS